MGNQMVTDDVTWPRKVEIVTHTLPTSLQMCASHPANKLTMNIQY